MFRQLLVLFLLAGCTAWAQQYSEEDIANRHTRAYPQSRLLQDWMYQDAGTLKVDGCFQDSQGNATEAAMVKKVLDELAVRGVKTSFGETLAKLTQENVPGADPRWKELYLAVCQERRVARLKVFEGQNRKYLFVKHFVFGDAQAMFAMTDHLTDAVFRERGRDYRMGSQLCVMEVAADGNVSTSVIYDCPTGIVRDPCLSWDGKTLVFSMRKTDENGGDDFHLYKMDMSEGSKYEPKQISFGAGTADMEPEWLPNGNLIFTSTRCVVSAPCWWSSVCNLYTCDAEGRYIRRLGVDHGHTVFPHVTNEGAVTYTRWEYSDRTAGYLHSLFIMNADGTNQIEFYGNQSQFPAAILHARNVPNSQKFVAVAGAHHIDQRGKLILIDRKAGINAGAGISYLAPERPMPYAEGQGTSGNVVHGTDGEQFQYPWPLDEENYLVGYLPEGGPIRGLKGIKDGKQGSPAFGIYWMNKDGQRELLVYDPVISACQQVPFAPRPVPVQKASPVNEHLDSGYFYVQNVYYGPGLEGIPKGAVKKMRIVALDYRVKGTIALGLHPWGGHQTTPCAINNGSYDIKHVLGTVDVEPDGSCFFECPSRTPVFFQMLDEKGHMIQNMRSWTMVMPGEHFACIGCHEDKNSTFIDRNPITDALKKAPQKIQPFFAPGEEPIQEMERFLNADEKRARAYLTTNAPQATDIPRGFSYVRDVQPIWDAHCIQCHAGEKNPTKKDVPLNLLGDDRIPTNEEIYGRTKWRLSFRGYEKKEVGKPGRIFSESYLQLTDFGYNAKICPIPPKSDAVRDGVYLKYFGGDKSKVPQRPNAKMFDYDYHEYDGSGVVCWLQASSTPQMLAPYSYGSGTSRLMKYLEPSHYGVKLSQKEKDAVACWIDLNVPFCGAWMERNYWDKLNHGRDSALSPWYVYRDKMREVYLYFEAKRLQNALLEVKNRDMYLEHVDDGKEYTLADFPVYTFGGQEVQKKFIQDYGALSQTVPIIGKSADAVVNLAVNPDAYAYYLRSYPRAISNSHYKYRPEFSPANVINGKDGYWRPLRQTDAWLQIELGRQIETEKVVLKLHLEPGQTKTWTGAVLEFSNGFKVPVELKCTADPQEFTFPKQVCEWVRITELKDSFPLGDNGIAEVQVWGKEAVKNSPENLFDGKTLADFDYVIADPAEVEKIFKLENGILKVTSGSSAWLATKRKYRDFQLSIEVRYPEDGFLDSGLSLRMTRLPDRPSVACVEVQMKSTNMGDLWGCNGFRIAPVGKAFAALGTPYTSTPRLQDPRAGKGADHWYHVKAVCQGKKLTVFIDGQKVNECEMAEEMEGALGIQTKTYANQKSVFPIWFRNAVITPLE